MLNYEQSNTRTLYVTVSDGVYSSTEKLIINIKDVNEAPTVSPVSDVLVMEDSGKSYIYINGISDGDESDIQNVDVDVSTDNSSLFSELYLLYTKGFSTAKLVYRPAPNKSGQTTIHLNITDDAGTAHNGKDTYIYTFNFTVEAINDAPYINPMSEIVVDEDSGLKSTEINGLYDGDNNQQEIEISYTSSNPSLLSSFMISYKQKNPVVVVNFVPAENQNGVTTITLTIKDNGGIENNGEDTFIWSFNIRVNKKQYRPAISNISKVTQEDTGLKFSANDFITVFTDVDNEELKSIKITRLPHAGKLIINSKEVIENQTIELRQILIRQSILLKSISM